MSYTIVFATSALRDLERLPGQIVQRILNAIHELENNPRPPGCKKIVGSQSTYRIRVGQFRVIYEVDDQQRVVLVTRIRHRKGCLPVDLQKVRKMTNDPHSRSALGRAV